MTVEGRFAAAVDSVFASSIVSSAGEHFARSGHYRLRIKFASPLLASSLLPSFIPTVCGDADLSVVFAGASDFDLSGLIPEPRGVPHVRITDTEYAAWQPAENGHDVLSVLNLRSRQGLVWLARDIAPAWYASRPAMPLLHAMVRDTEWGAVHGGCVGLGDRCLLLAGKGKSGKTTATLACALSGWNYAGDDFILANAANGQAEPLFATARLRSMVATEFSDLLAAGAARSEEDGDPRHELRLGPAIGNERFAGGHIEAILLPRRQGAETITFTPARRIDAFHALLPNTSMALLGWFEKTTEKVASLVGRAPAFFVDTGNRPADIPDAFARFLDGL